MYLLDDPLSAVDAHVGQFLFHEGIRNGLNGKTRILVTHQVHLLPYFDQIIVLDNGVIKAVGKYEELKKSGVDIEAYVPATTNAADASEEDELPPAPGSIPAGSVRTAKKTLHNSDHSGAGTNSGINSGSNRT